ncbi:hypothetical protein SCH4B_0046 [Ruegeria sp. TrichCH4B]|nr:hypothetical protein SCH4B_0046 [Ruegeria sp. TrichCH4B]
MRVNSNTTPHFARRDQSGLAAAQRVAHSPRLLPKLTIATQVANS